MENFDRNAWRSQIDGAQKVAANGPTKSASWSKSAYHIITMCMISAIIKSHSAEIVIVVTVFAPVSELITPVHDQAIMNQADSALAVVGLQSWSI